MSDVKPPTRRTTGSNEHNRGFWPSEGAKGRGLRSPRTLLVIGITAAVLLIALVAGVVVFRGGQERPAGDTAAADSQSLPLVYVADKSTKEMAKLDARAQDARALTVDEVFTPDVKQLEGQGYQFALGAADLVRDCASATWGTELQAALRKYGCNQILRGVYASKDNKHAGQFAVINLEQVTGSHEILRNLDPRSRDGFLRPLTSKAVARFGAGFSAAYVTAAGHYVVIVWVQRLGGAQPASINELLNASLAIQKADEFIWQRLTLVESAS